MKRAILAGCSALMLSGCIADGSATMLKGAPPAIPIPADQVEIFLEEPKEPYEKIAVVSASAHTTAIISRAQAEQMALQQLKVEGGKVGAHGVLLQDGSSRISEVYSLDSAEANVYGGYGYANVNAVGTSSTGIKEEYTFRGYAIRFHGRPIPQPTPEQIKQYKQESKQRSMSPRETIMHSK